MADLIDALIGPQGPSYSPAPTPGGAELQMANTIGVLWRRIESLEREVARLKASKTPPEPQSPHKG